jgi:hypothetical protein
MGPFIKEPFNSIWVCLFGSENAMSRVNTSVCLTPSQLHCIAYTDTSRDITFKACQLLLKKLNEQWKNIQRLMLLYYARRNKLHYFSVTKKPYCYGGLFCLQMQLHCMRTIHLGSFKNINFDNPCECSSDNDLEPLKTENIKSKQDMGSILGVQVV